MSAKFSEQQSDKVMVGIDRRLSNALDEWRDGCTAINRSALVNQILMQWLREEGMLSTPKAK